MDLMIEHVFCFKVTRPDHGVGTGHVHRSTGHSADLTIMTTAVSGTLNILQLRWGAGWVDGQTDR